MTISAVITTFNRRELLREALTSVRAQTRAPDQIVIVDDGSTDGTREEMEATAGIDYHWQPNGGTSSARNVGWEMARGEWIAFLDSDDLWEKEKLAGQESAALADPSCEAVFGHAINFASPGTEHLFDTEKHRMDHPRPAWLPGAALIRRSTLLQMGGFDLRVKTAEVIDWFLRLRECETKMIMLPELVMRRRLHGSNKRLESDNGQRENFALIHAWNQRRVSSRKRPEGLVREDRRSGPG